MCGTPIYTRSGIGGRRTPIIRAVLTGLALSVLLGAAVQEPVPSPSAAAVSGSKVWLGRAAEYEEFLKKAPIDHVAEVGSGVTHPWRAFFKPGGLAGSAIFKKLPPSLKSGFWESYKSEIAAYELDKLLSMDMVPPTVERRYEGDNVSFQLWVEDTQLLRKLQGKASPDVDRWNRQVYRHRVFDNLIANIDRNAGNLLVDRLWNLILIDHSRAFTDTKTMPFETQMNRIDRPFYDRVAALEFATLKEKLGPWVMGDGWIRAILKRRDRIVEYFKSLAAAKGDAEVFLP
jgi:hypothetical protein